MSRTIDADGLDESKPRAKKTPQPGEWWVHDEYDIKRFIAGINSAGSIVCEYKDGSFDNETLWHNWHHEPRCTGWDWTPDEQTLPTVQPRKYVRLWMRKEIGAFNPMVCSGVGGMEKGWTEIKHDGKGFYCD